MSFKRNTAVTGFTFGMVSSTDGSDITTGTPVGYFTLDGGVQTAIGDVTPVHEGNGQWSFDLLAAEMNGDVVGLVFTHASALSVHFTISTVGKLVSDLQDISTTQVNTEVDLGISDAALATSASIAALNDVAATDIVSAGAITTLTGAVVNVDTVDSNADMRGTDAAALATALITAQNDLDLITGADGVTLATAQVLYAPNKVAPDNTGIASILTDTGTTLPASLAVLQTDTDDIQTRLPATLVGGLMSSDVTAISTDTSAADNLELMYDGTGYTADTAPASRSQVGSLSTASAAISKRAESGVVNTGVVDSGTYTDTFTVNQTYHQITDSAGVFDTEYTFDIGGNGVGTEITMIGRLTGNGDTLPIQCYNYISLAWEQVGLLVATNSTEDYSLTFNLDVAHTGDNGVDLGKVKIRGFAAASFTATLYLDHVYISYAVVSETVGYALGRIWVNTVNGISGTESYVNGVADNPVATLAEAKIIADQLGIRDFNISSDSTLTLAANLNNYNVYGIGYTLNTAGFDCGDTHFFHASPVNGVVVAASGHVDIVDSIIAVQTVNELHYTNCSFTASVTLGSVNGDIKVINSRSVIAGASTPIFDFGTAAGIGHNMTIANWQNGIEVRNYNNSGTDRFSLSGTGQLVVAATCSGTMNIRGQWKITDNSGGNVTFVYDDVRTEIDDIQIQIGTAGAGLSDLGGMSTGMKAEVNIEADLAITDYDPPTNAELEARTPTAAQLAYIVSNAATGLPVTFTTAGGSTVLGVLNLVDNAAASAVDDQYNGRLLVFTDGSLKGVVTDITDYVGATKTATITAIPTAPLDTHNARLI